MASVILGQPTSAVFPAANGLSANFCQNCAAPIGQARILNHPGRAE